MISGVFDFWFVKPSNLFNSFCLLPLNSMDSGEKLNALTRLIILSTFIIKLISWDTFEWFKFLISGLIVIFLIWFSLLVT